MHPLIGILAPCQGHGFEVFLVFHLLLLSPLAMLVISTFTLISYPDDINLDRTSEWVTVSDRNKTWTSLRKE